MFVMCYIFRHVYVRIIFLTWPKVLEPADIVASSTSLIVVSKYWNDILLRLLVIHECDLKSVKLQATISSLV